MTLYDIRDKVPSNVKLMLDDESNSIDVLVNNVHTGYLYDTPEGMYFKTVWVQSRNWDDYANIRTFLFRFKYELLIKLKHCSYDCRIYRLTE